MTYNIRRLTHTKTSTTTWPTGDRKARVCEAVTEKLTVYGTEDVLTYLTKLLSEHNVFCSRLKTCIKFESSTETYDAIEKQLHQKFPQS